METIIFLGLFVGFIYMVLHKCPKCKKRFPRKTNEQLIGERWTHPKKDGGKDNRYKNNPLIKKYKYFYSCEKCSHKWNKIKEI